MSKRKDDMGKLEILRRRAQGAGVKYRDALDKHQQEVALPKLRRAVGKCYRYMNRYSSDESWPLYVKIVSINESNCGFECVQFQKTSDGKIIIELAVKYNYGSEYENYFGGARSGYTEITPVEYNRAVSVLMRQIVGVFNCTPKRKASKKK